MFQNFPNLKMFEFSNFWISKFQKVFWNPRCYQHLWCLYFNGYHPHHNSHNINTTYWVLDSWWEWCWPWCSISKWSFRYVALTGYFLCGKSDPIHSKDNNTITFITFILTPIMAWCERALEKCESPKDESHHAKRKSHQALKRQKWKVKVKTKKSHHDKRKSHKALNLICQFLNLHELGMVNDLDRSGSFRREPPYPEKKLPGPEFSELWAWNGWWSWLHLACDHWKKHSTKNSWEKSE